MASIFTYDPDPPRISSPWSTQGRAAPARTEVKEGLSGFQVSDRGAGTPPAALLADCGITRLEAEPQEGPTEYKLHLLLRKRRSLTSSTTGNHIGGSFQSRAHIGAPHAAKPSLLPGLGTSPAPPAGFSQSRQHRLQQLTTQLLWRLQQSSPNHSSSLSNLVVPTFPELPYAGDSPTRPGRLLPGLEESHGALYEIGVSDDGTFVGLTEDEMDESLNNLRAMAASLGCNVRVLRMVVVGECQWTENASSSEDEAGHLRNDRLWVAEALVKPDLGDPLSGMSEAHASRSTDHAATRPVVDTLEDQSPTEQLRVSLTGATTSGKSSLLGTLSTATLDNGRGKSRLSLLRHRHELVSGVTSSVAQELLGYQPAPANVGEAATVVNFASGNVSSWMDIHASCESGRLVFFSDSAGHPRYRRTTVRGLVGWAPDWTVLCIAADRDEPESVKPDATDQPGEPDGPSSVTGPSESSIAHLELCLRLGVPMVVVFTKLDRASKAGLRQALTETLSILKSAGRKPVVLPASAKGASIGPEPDLQSISHRDHEIASQAVEAVNEHAPGVVVPIVLASAVTGMGIGAIHALLRMLPCPGAAILPETTNAMKSLFHIEDVFALPKSAVISTDDESQELKGVQGAIVSGHLRYGEIVVGDELLLGPLPPSPAPAVVENGSSLYRHECPSPRPTLTNGQASHTPSGHQTSALDATWRRVRVVSVRNLRLPVRRILAGQVGTIGFIDPAPTDVKDEKRAHQLPGSTTSGIPGLRKGMVLCAGGSSLPPSCTSFSGVFDGNEIACLSAGSLVVVYVASVRAVAKIVSICPEMVHTDVKGQEDAEDVFGFDGHLEEDDSPVVRIAVRFRFTATREWIEVGTRVLVMPAGARTARPHQHPAARTGRDEGRMRSAESLLEGFVGVITEAYD